MAKQAKPPTFDTRERLKGESLERRVHPEEGEDGDGDGRGRGEREREGRDGHNSESKGEGLAATESGARSAEGARQGQVQHMPASQTPLPNPSLGHKHLHHLPWIYIQTFQSTPTIDTIHSITTHCPPTLV
ncbi:hypothetical protein M758_11G032400 [Ceratodon purpureus]|nr:hypothetical protein M758_11G032400 [Ceratodon purpureus]